MHKYVKRRWMLPFFSYILPNFIPAFLFQINVLNGKVQYKSWLIFQSSQYKLFVAPKFLVQLYHKLATKRLYFGGKVNLLVCDISRNINDEIGKFTKNNNKCYFCHEQFQKQNCGTCQSMRNVYLNINQNPLSCFNRIVYGNFGKWSVPCFPRTWPQKSSNCSITFG